MTETFADLRRRAIEWRERARAEGWLDEPAARRLEAVDRPGPADLFHGNDGIRPLVVALFGGTGVGKSSLLNRLAGAPLARTGAQRPTSRHVTVYVHADARLDDAGLGEIAPSHRDGGGVVAGPADPDRRTVVVRHRIDARRDVLWLDAPDIDSVDEDNRRLALAWLPRIDLLIYVVSPERYRDDVGWKVLREHGHRHGWMFVMNRWDEGDPRQVDDWRTILTRAGFADPLLFCTSCAEHPTRPASSDEFDQIESTIRTILDEHGLRELERLGHRARLRDWAAGIAADLARFGDAAGWRHVREALSRRWRQARVTILDGMAWSLRARARRASHAVGPATPARGQRLAGVIAAARGDAPVVASSDATAAQDAAAAPPEAPDAVADASLWDEWAAGRLAECIDELEVELRRVGITPATVRARLARVAEEAANTVARATQRELRHALARPGSAWQRGVQRAARAAMVGLPLVALIAVAVQVVLGYYRAATEGTPFLGHDFALHSALLVLVSWALPFAVERAVRPSIEENAVRGLTRGFQAALDELSERLEAAVDETADAAAKHRTAAQELLTDFASFAAIGVPPPGAVVARAISAERRSPSGTEISPVATERDGGVGRIDSMPVGRPRRAAEPFAG